MRKGCNTTTVRRGRSAMAALSAAAFLVFLMLPASAPCAPSEDGFISARMEAKVAGTGLDARAAATQKAQDDILRQILKTSLSMEDPALVQPLLGKKDLYIRSTQLLRYETTDGATLVEVECSLNRNLLLQDAAAFIMPKMSSPPTALILVAEQAGQSPMLLQGGTVEKELARILGKASFEVIDSASVHVAHSDAEIIDAVKAGNDAAGAFAREGFADVVVMGEASAESESPEQGKDTVFKNSGKVALRVFRARDGKCMDSLAATAVVHSANPQEGAEGAFEDACAKFADTMTVLCVMAVAGERPRDELVITLEEPGAMERLEAFVKYFGESTGQKDVDVLLFSEHLARVRVRYDGAMIPLMDTLTHAVYEGMTLETRKALQRNVTMRFVPR